MRPIYLSKVLATAAANNICLSQTPAAGGAQNLTINGALATGGVATLDTPRFVGITSAGNDSGRTFTVYGTNGQGHSISEAVTGPNATVVSTVSNFATVTRISVDANTAGAITVGTTALGCTNAIPLDKYIAPHNTGLFFDIGSGTVTGTVQYTADDVFGTVEQDLLSWTDHPNLTSKNTKTDSSLTYPASAVRLKVTTGTGTAKLTILQAGIGGV